MFQNADDAKKFIADEGVEFVDVRFCDLPGVMQHFTVPAKAFDPAEELAFDGSSIRGFQAIHESDMALRADLTTARVDPFRRDKTLNINFFIHDPITGEQSAFFGPEAEFYVFDSVRFETSANRSVYEIDSEAGAWNTGSEVNNRGYKVRYKGGYFPAPPVDHFADLRAEISLELDKAGLEVERQHHEVGTAGQAEINYKFNTLLAAADDLMLFKYIVKNVAWRNNKTATFMPKPIFGDNGSGMHVHQSLWTGGQPLFYDEQGYAGLSDIARYYIGGILKHAPSLLAFTNPTVNSYHRLVPGFEAPVNLVYSQRNRSAAMRIPITGSNPKAKRVEFRAPDPSSNPYLAFSALLLAGLDGIKNKIEPAEPIDKDLYELAPEEHAGVPQVPTSLPAVLDALEADNEYLQAGGVFTSDLIETWIDYKRTAEIAPIQLRPHPHEFELYFDI
ncbi:type I glutamate--ammonia ligase [Streptomyces sp. NEAU-H3]|uniref:type I glutamate--ammonia ligase n=1 Tax=Streptomyces sp. NEAU-H3 TaxID=2720636 RepID=UPI00143961E0|nr:type I glutamate--ammonia ligase [Streptomyces sp. NEAU-H3]NJA58291.1 type I glutamate--ammonia ligase [Streptomyces sp. NEAU-H3]